MLLAANVACSLTQRCYRAAHLFSPPHLQMSLVFKLLFNKQLSTSVKTDDTVKIIGTQANRRGRGQRLQLEQREQMNKSFTF